MSVIGGRPRSTGVALLMAVLGSAMLSVSTTGTTAAFTAGVSSPANRSTVSRLTMSVSSTGGTCSSAGSANNSASCTAINAYTATALGPGGSGTSVVTVRNTGTLTPSTFALRVGSCTQSGSPAYGSPASDLCSRISLSAYEGPKGSGRLLYQGRLAAAGGAAFQLAPLAPGTAQDFTFVVTVDDVDNRYQSLVASQPITFAFTQ